MPQTGLEIPSSSTPCLTLVGVGPGDPSLLTLAAIHAIKNATVIAYPVTREGDAGVAATIASQWMTEKQELLPLLFPMVYEPAPRKRAWQGAGQKLATLVAKGEQVVFLCQGDASLFASSSYVLLDIKANHSECPVKIIPGITSISAAAAFGEWPLSLQNEQLLVMPTPDNAEALEEILDDSASLGRVLALIKLGNRWIWVRDLLERKKLLEASLFAQRVGFPDQLIVPANKVSAEEKPYFSLLLIRQSWPEVIPS